MNIDFLIAGDSWACGEWDQELGIMHPGLSGYMAESGLSTINIGTPGGSNAGTILRLKTFLKTNPSMLPKRIIVFQTEWVRDCAEDPTLISQRSTESVDDFGTWLVCQFYYRLSELSVKYDIPIYLIGGCADTVWIDQFDKEYPGLHIACQSVTNLLIHGHHRIYQPIFNVWGQDPELITQHRFKQQFALDELLKSLDLGESRRDSWKSCTEYFWPDGCHPNRRGHKKLFEFLQAQGLFDESR